MADINEEKTEEGDGKTKQYPKTLKFQSKAGLLALNNMIQAIKNTTGFEYEGKTLSEGRATELIVEWANQKFIEEGYSSGVAVYSNQYMTHFEVQLNNAIRWARNAFHNCDADIFVIRKDCDDKVKVAEEKLTWAKSESAKKLEENAAFIAELETSNAELSDDNVALLKQNEALNSLKAANEKNADALEKERETLSGRIVQLQHASEKNVELLKAQQKYEAQIADLSKEMNDLKHQHQLLSKEAEIGFQRILATATANATAEAEQKLRYDLDPIISDLKSQITGLNKQLRSERTDAEARVKAARDEERAAAGKQIDRLQEIIKGEMESLQSAQALALSAAGEKNKRERHSNEEKVE